MGNYATSTDVANDALSMLGSGPIADLNATADSSDKVLTNLQQWYNKAVEMVVRDLHYELDAQIVTPVAILVAPPQVTPEWLNAFYYDPTWTTLVRILSGAYPDSKETEVPHRKVNVFGSAELTVTGVSKANPGVVTVSGAVNGQVVKFASIGGMTQLNGNTYFVSDATATTCQLKKLSDGSYLDTTSFTTYTTGGTMTPQDHQRVLCNIMPGQYRDGSTSPQFEVGMVPNVPMWPTDFAICVATKLAALAGVGIVGIDRKDKVDTLKEDYKVARANASANINKQSFKGARQISRSTLSRMHRNRPRNEFNNGTV